jgi:outer membrane protein assembly factor BamB
MIPLVADGHVFAASARGRIWALNPHTGRVAWTGRLGTRVRAASGFTQPGMAAGYGYLLVPTADGVAAFRRVRFPTR